MANRMDSSGNHPLLSAVVVIGDCRERSQRCVDALYQQTAAHKMEIVIVDLGAEAHTTIKTQGKITTTMIQLSRDVSWAAARKAGIERTLGSIIAFIEDHAVPESDWACSVIEAHQGPWAAVGYAFTNANPDTYISRASLIADYALWMDPLPSGPAGHLPGNNVSYKRDILLALGDRLGEDLGVDFNIHEALKKLGYKLYLEGRALVAHENYDTLGALLQANHHYCRLLAADRTTSGSWSPLKRIVYGVGTPIGAPVIKSLRLLKSLKGRLRVLKPILVSSPILLLTYIWSAIGESLGYLIGRGGSSESFTKWELNLERITR